MKNLINLFLGCLILAIAGCASVGKSFNYQNRNSILLGKTTNKQYIVVMLGKPKQISTVGNTEGNFIQNIYSFAHANPSGSAARMSFLNLGFWLSTGRFTIVVWNCQLFPIDSANKIKVGVTTIEEVERYLGQPSGKAFYPTALGRLKELRCDRAHTYYSWIAYLQITWVW